MGAIVVLFTRTTKEEAHSKHFHPHFDLYSNRQFVNLLIDQTIDTIKASGLPYQVCYSNEQVGNTFSERFTNAINDAFSKGYDRVITIGNDTPLLNSTHLIKAANTSKLVLGPSVDGGFYLMGISKGEYSQELFNSFSWGKSSLLYEVLSKFKETQLLDKLRDIDTAEDFKLLLNSKCFSRTIRLFIRTALSLVETTIENPEEYSSSIQFISQKPLRSPPLY